MAIEDLKWAEQDVTFPETANPNKVGNLLPTILQDEGFHPYQGYDAEIFNEWMNRAWKSVEDLQTQINGLSVQVATGIEPAFPVGSFYINKVDGTNPETLLGFGTWVAVEGVAIAGAGTYTDSRGEQRTFTAGNIEGVYKHVLTTNELAAHSHQAPTSSGQAGNFEVANSNNKFDTDFVGAANTSSVGGSQPHNNMQPTLFAYVWERTA